jgi:hypothetical protein
MLGEQFITGTYGGLCCESGYVVKDKCKTL